MLNKFYKIINNKYSGLFSFLFFLRYLFAIFFISTAIFLIIPNFFNYEKKLKFVKNYLSKNYNLKIINYETIKFKSLPLPKLELRNVDLESEKISKQFKVENLRLYPKIFSIYNYENFQTNKIILKNNNISLESSELMTFIRLIVLNKRKLFLNNLNIEITNEGKRVLKLEDLKYANFGYNKNLILGKIFEKNFKVNLDKQFESIVFSIQNSGINVDINFNDNKKNNKISGTFKSKIINTNIKLNFDYDDNILKITNFNLRNKNISFKNESFVVFKPFSQINSRFDIQEFDKKIFKIINLNDLLSEKNILKKISIKSEIYFTPKNFIKFLSMI